jgi:hypothetical protein
MKQAERSSEFLRVGRRYSSEELVTRSVIHGSHNPLPPMFYDPDRLPVFSFDNSGATTAANQESRHLVNRLRLEFRTASQRQLEDAVEAAAKTANTYAGEKILQLARASLGQLLTPSADRPEATEESEPPFRATSE